MFDFDNTKIIFDDNGSNPSFVNEKTCPRCNTKLTEVLRSGIVGCATCYKIFENEIRSLILKKQGSINHVGKISAKHISKIKIKEKLAELELQKQKAADEENYIVAESLKNQIEKLKGEL